MSRIRTIKPMLFFDYELAMLDVKTRYFFIGLFTQADKEGKGEDIPNLLRAKIFPYEKFNADQAMSDLSKHFIIRYKSNGRSYYKIKSFLKHQKPHHTEFDSIIPDPDGSSTVLEPLQHALGIGNMEYGIGNRSIIPGCLLKAWNEMASKSGGSLATIRGLSKSRIAKVQVRLKEHSMEDWQLAINKILESSFLKGEVKDKEGKSWRATFDWLIDNDKNVLKILEGNYANRSQSYGADGNYAAHIPGKYAHLSGMPNGETPI